MEEFTRAYIGKPNKKNQKVFISLEHLLFHVIWINQKGLAPRNIVSRKANYVVEPKALYTPSDFFSHTDGKKKKSFLPIRNTGGQRNVLTLLPLNQFAELSINTVTLRRGLDFPA